MPPDVRKGSAFPTAFLIIRGYASSLRRSLNKYFY
jgi:hypothetical protein